MEIGIIYKAINLINGKIYIGQTIVELKKRIRGHYNKTNIDNSNSKFCNALRKYRREDWKWEVLYENIPRKMLNNMEIWTIGNYNSYNFGYNSTTGGDTPSECSEETRKKLSIALTGREFSEEHRQKISKFRLGKPLSEETKQKIGRPGEKHPLYGKPRSEETKQKISQTLTGHSISEETREKLSLSQSGENNGFFGKHHDEQTKKKLSDIRSAQSALYKITKPNGEIEIVKNLRVYCENNNLTVSSMRNVIKGKCKPRKGYPYKGYKVEKIIKE